MSLNYNDKIYNSKKIQVNYDKKKLKYSNIR